VGNAPGDGTDPSGLWASLWDETKGVFGYIFSNKVETIKLTTLGIGEGFNNIFIQPAYRTGQFVGDTVVIFGWDANHEPRNPYLNAYLNNRIGYFEAWLSITLEAESTFIAGCPASKAIKNPSPIRPGDSTTARGPTRIYSAKELIRRAEESGPFHNFPEFFNAEIFRGTRQIITDSYILYTQRGSINGVKGTFEIGVRSSASGRTEVIVHRFFRPDPSR
jgi:hypothetical protein